MPEQRNLILAVVLSMVILLGFQFFGERPQQPQTATEQAGMPPAMSGGAPGQQVATPVPMAPAAPGPAGFQPPAAAVDPGPRVRIDAPSVHGSIALTGARVDQITLVKYRETLDPNSPEIILLSPYGTQNPYFAEFGWSAAGQGVTLPGPDARWTADHAEVTPTQPVTLSWSNGAGLRFERTFAIDDNYMFTVTQRVVNNGPTPVTLSPYALISRFGMPHSEGGMSSILHEGPVGVLDGTLKEKSYSDLKGANETFAQTTTGGWIGITDKYWLVALAPDQKANVNARFFHKQMANTDLFQVDYLGQPQTVAPGGVGESTGKLFTGAKEAQILDHYRDVDRIDRFDLAIDFGWFYFLTKPFFYALQFLHGVFGNFGIAILALTVIVKLLFYPLANKSYQAMSKMKKLQPEMKKLQERFSDDKVRLNQEMMALYKREKANPASGCLPLLIQIPVFFALYKVLFVTIEMRHAPFFGWIQDLSAPDPTSVFNLFGLIPWQPPEMMLIGIWPLIMGVTMWLQQKLNPQPTDPMQAKVFAFLPIIFTVMLARFAAGLVIYWAWNNSLSILQQWVIMKRMGVKP